MSLLRGAIVDGKGMVDVGNLTVLWVAFVVLGVIIFDCVMTAVDYWRCTSNCHFDPLPVSQATGLVATAFAGCLTALGAYFRLTPADVAAADASAPPKEVQ